MRTKRPGRVPLILDGTYFEVLSRDEKTVVAKCITCLNEEEKETIIKGSSGVSSNFSTHLKRHKKAYEEFQLYKLNESGAGGNGKTGTVAKKKTVSEKRPPDSPDDPADISDAASYQSKGYPEDNVDGDFVEADTIEHGSSSGGVVGGESGSVYRYRRNQNSDRLPEKLKELYVGQMGSLSDVTLFGGDGSYVKAHKVILALCSPYFQQIFKKISHASQATGNTGNATVVVLGNVKTSVLKCLVEFIYTGEAAVKLEEMDEFLKTGELYQIDGICTAPPQQQEKSSFSKNIKTEATTKITARKRTSVPTSSSRIISVRVVHQDNTRNEERQSYIPRQRRKRRTKDKEIGNDDSSEESDLELDEDDGTLRRSSRVSRPVNTQCKTEPPEVVYKLKHLS